MELFLFTLMQYISAKFIHCFCVSIEAVVKAH